MKLGNSLLACVSLVGGFSCSEVGNFSMSVECTRNEIAKKVSELCSDHQNIGFDLKYMSDVTVKDGIVYAGSYAGQYVNCQGVFALPENLENFDFCMMTNL